MSERRAFSVAVFARFRERVLLIHHARLGAWLPVGGEIENGETPLEAARRELREETGLEGRFDEQRGVDGTPPGLLGYEEHAAGSKGLHLNFAFAADVESERVAPNHEFSEFRWVSSAELAAIGAPANVQQLAAAALGGLDRIAHAWLRAFNARDLDALLALYADDAVHTSPRLRARSPETNGEVRGKSELRAWWRDSMERLPRLRYELRHLTSDGERVVMEYERTHPGEPDQSVAEVLVVRGGLIRASRVYLG